ncbi:MAG: hypothetical protein ACLSA6_04350 [Holdemania massiliensis]
MDKKKWERWINNSAESVDWMIDKMEAKGLHVCLEPGYYDPDGVLTVPSASHNFWNEEQPFGALFGAPLQAQAYASHIADMGGEIHYKTIAKYLIRENENTAEYLRSSRRKKTAAMLNMSDARRLSWPPATSPAIRI